MLTSQQMLIGPELNSHNSLLVPMNQNSLELNCDCQESQSFFDQLNVLLPVLMKTCFCAFLIVEKTMQLLIAVHKLLIKSSPRLKELDYPTRAETK